MLQKLAAFVPDERAEADAAPVYLWLEHVRAFEAFKGLQTQWRTGMQGATGLDHAAVLAVLHATQPRRQVAQVYRDICVLELATLGYWHEERKRRTDQPV